MVFPASRSSFVCRCPKGLRGYDCSQVDNPCDRRPCQNNAQCIPFALRDYRKMGETVMDESIFDKYRCECPPYFYGEHCEILTTPDFVMEFRKYGINDYVEVNGMNERLSEISLCTWMQTEDAFNYGTIISYATEGVDNMFTLTDYNGFVLYVNGSNIITDVNINDGLWHFICVAWTRENGFYEIHVDGSLHDTGYNLSANSLIESNGIFVIGQEQDSLGTSFSDSESFVGKIAYLDIWNRFLSSSEVLEYYSSCEPYHGNLYAWSDFKNHIKGDIKISSSPFCKPCINNVHISNGYIRNVGNRAFHYCHDGYRLEGPIVRDCLRTSQWSLPVPYCRSIRCGYLPTLANGVETVEKTTFGEEVSYTCNDGYRLVSGSQKRICMLNGTWSGTHPECRSNIQCNRLEPPENAKIIYANERGTLSNNLEKYSKGTFAEIQCEYDMVIDGENFLSCTESTQWDYPLPKCVVKVTTDSKLIQNSSIFENYELSTEAFDDLRTSTSAILNQFNFQVASTQFLQSFKKFLYHGCQSHLNTASELCSKTSKIIPFIDLSIFQPPETNEPMDRLLLQHLERCVRKLDEFSQNLTFDNAFDCIVESENSPGMSENLENSLRLIISFYIDTVTLDTDSMGSVDTNDASITEKIKRHLTRIVTVILRNYLNDIANTTSRKPDNFTQKSTEPIGGEESQCNLMAIPNLPSRSVIKNVTDNNQALFPDIDNIRKVSLFVSETSKINFGCENGFELIGKDYTECLNGDWQDIKFDCEQIFCENPPNPMNMNMDDILSETNFSIGYKLQLKCKNGYTLYGSPLIFCTSNGWTKVMARCSKISCNKPNISNELIIVDGWSYLYLDKLKLKCENGSIVEIECQSNGQWSPNLNTVCISET